MTPLETAEMHVDAEIQSFELKLRALKQVKLALNANELKGTTALKVDSIPISTKIRRVKSGNSLIPEVYHKRLNEVDKMRFIIHELNKPCSKETFISKVKEYESEKSATINKIDRTIRGLAHPNKGEWLYFIYKNSKKRFYIKAEWLGDDKRSLKDVNYPDASEVLHLPPEEVIPENIIWQDSQ